MGDGGNCDAVLPSEARDLGASDISNHLGRGRRSASSKKASRGYSQKTATDSHRDFSVDFLSLSSVNIRGLLCFVFFVYAELMLEL